MNETKITPRQSLILNLINKEGGLSRSEIQREISKTHKISKPTLVRDLNDLVEKGLIRIAGKGRATEYLPKGNNPLLRVFNLNQYFAREADERSEAKTEFDFSVFDHLNNLFSEGELKELQETEGAFEGKATELPADILRRELERFVIELSWKSSKIEGNTYTLLQTEELIKDRKEAKGKSREESQMILNHKAAFETILENKKDFKKLNLSKVNQLHNILVKDLRISTGIRKQPVGITGTVYKPLDNEFQIKDALQKFITIVNSNKNPFEKALTSSAMIPYIQPYSDGNKRTGRMLTNAILLAYGCYPLSYRSLDETEFKQALILFYEQNSLYHIKRLFLEQYHFAVKNYLGN